MYLDISKNTRDKILNAAESLIAEFGLEGVSLRQITKRAGVNLAAVNYHYHDKETLCRDIITHRLRMINSLRMKGLMIAEARYPDGIVPLHEIFEIMARPLFLAEVDLTAYNVASRRVLGRIMVEPLPFSADILAEELQPVMTRFSRAIRRHVPSLSPRDFMWRYSLVVGSMHHAMATMHAMKDRTKGICRDDDHEAALRNFIVLAAKTFSG